MAIKNRIGEKHSLLTVVSFFELDKKQNAIWKCQCRCGRFTNVKGYHLKNTMSCGCVRDKKLLERVMTHGDTRNGSWSKLYRTWKAIKSRCNNPNDKSFKWYGARGIYVCPEWCDDFSKFKEYVLREIGDKPIGLSIDRTNNDQGYKPGNIRWATQSQQVLNSRNCLQ